ncbi:hypothetical protein NQK81_01390 [Amycolatopsis roodepoortensis]|uniref:DUF7715 family protein n=1 Tax=Amycolatopsis roodepoortensis TaxID=700274 RepID=UPI00214CD6EC|nr:hypothetical protein [Amycolatopsis roodepoortensis]UUV32129.1 hypothetical protein NQK81_01390 [Amycolatopsis roodepoortensis]
MRLLVATTATQGHRSSDFNVVFRTEPVLLAPICGRDGDDPDGACGCARAFISIRSGRPVTTAAVTDRDITPGEYRTLLRFGYRTSGAWGDLTGQDIDGLAERTATELEHLISGLRPGTVLERRGDTIATRTWTPTAGQPRHEPDADHALPDHDNTMVWICAYGDDRDELFPAWVSPTPKDAPPVIPMFSRATAERVVDWTNRLRKAYHGAAAAALWDGDDILLYEPGWEDPDPIRITPDQHGRYFIGNGWDWDEVWCEVCYATARPGEDEGSQVLLHESGCVPVEQWPLADHRPRPRS